MTHAPEDLPQTENGFVRIANELFDAILLAGFGKRELLVLLAIVRKTYGFGKKADDMTHSQLAAVTGLTAAHVCETVRELEARGVITTSPGQFGRVIGVQKNYRNWKAEGIPKKPKSTTPKTGADSQNRNPETGMHSQNGIPESGVIDSQNGSDRLPKREDWTPETGRTKDNPNRQPQKTTPIEGSGHGPQPTAPEAANRKEAPTAATWKAYSEAFEDRFGVPPPRSARTSGILKQFIARIGADEAPEVARWFLGSNNRWYVEKGHDVACLLNDAEKLRTEWATRRRTTATSAQQLDRQQAGGQVWSELLDEVTP